MSSLRPLLLICALASVSSCHAASPQKPSPHVAGPRDSIDKSHPTAVPTATPTVTPVPPVPPTATPTASGAGPLTSGPIEVHVQPIEVQPPKGDLHLATTGIPEKITLDWQLKSVPLDLHWPKEDLRVAFGGIPQPLKIEWDIKPVPLNVHWPEESAKITFAVDNSTIRILQDEVEKRVTDLQKNLREELTNQLRDSNKRISGAVRKEINGKRLPPEKQQAKAGAIRIFLYIVLSGLFGGFCGGVWRFLRKKSASDRYIGSVGQSSSTDELLKNAQQLLLSFLEAFPEWGRGVLFGVFAALMFPAMSTLLGRPDLRAAAEDPYTLVRLCSCCFVLAMIGEIFVEWSLDEISRKLEDRRSRKNP
jgi:hypothetical protein